MMTFIIDKCERRLKNIAYQSDHDLYATYKGYDLQVAEQETGGFYATVKDPKGKKIIDNHVRGLYLPEAVKEVMKQICFKISSNTHNLTNEERTEQCNIPHVSKSVCDHDYVYKILHDHTAADVCIKCGNIKKQTVC